MPGVPSFSMPRPRDVSVFVAFMTRVLALGPPCPALKLDRDASLSDLRAASNNGMSIGPSPSNIAPAPAPIQILGGPLALPGGGVARFGR